MTPEELKEKMERYGYNDRTLADELGCTPQTVWKWRHKKTKVPAHVSRFFEGLERDEERAEEAYSQILSSMRHVPKPLRLRVIERVIALLEKDKS
jgi:hypothetical protein